MLYLSTVREPFATTESVFVGRRGQLKDTVSQSDLYISVSGSYTYRKRRYGMETTVAEHDGRMIARLEGSDRVFEVAFDLIEPTDVTLRFIRDEDRVGSIYNDDGTDRTMARLTTGRDGSDFIGVEVPTEFVTELVNAASEAGRITDGTALEGYRLRVL